MFSSGGRKPSLKMRRTRMTELGGGNSEEEYRISVETVRKKMEKYSKISKHLSKIKNSE